MKQMLGARHLRIKNVSRGAKFYLCSMPDGWEAYFETATALKKLIPRDKCVFRDMGVDEFNPIPFIKIPQEHLPQILIALQAHGSIALTEPGTGRNPQPYALITVLPHTSGPAVTAKPSALEDLL